MTTPTDPAPGDLTPTLTFTAAATVTRADGTTDTDEQGPAAAEPRKD